MRERIYKNEEEIEYVKEKSVMTTITLQFTLTLNQFIIIFLLSNSKKTEREAEKTPETCDASTSFPYIPIHFYNSSGKEKIRTRDTMHINTTTNERKCLKNSKKRKIPEESQSQEKKDLSFSSNFLISLSLDFSLQILYYAWSE